MESWRGFYNTKAWKDTRDAYKRSVGGLCERCQERGIIRAADYVHHKVHLTPQNVLNPEITLAWSNLQALCSECHAEVHRGVRRWKVMPDGTIASRSEP